MATTTEPVKKIHHGRNVRRFREWMGMKQEALASMLGDEWNQKKISHLEAKEEIEEALLLKLADTLKVPVDAIRFMDEEKAIFNIQNNYDNANGNDYQPTTTINNPIDKLMEVVDKNDKLREQNEKLYEALLKSEREKVEMLQRLLEKNK